MLLSMFVLGTKKGKKNKADYKESPNTLLQKVLYNSKRFTINYYLHLEAIDIKKVDKQLTHAMHVKLYTRVTF